MSFQWKDSYLKSIQWQCKKYFSAFQEDILYKYWQRSRSLKLTVNVKKRKNPFLFLDRKCWGENGNICPLPTWINLLKSIRHDISIARQRESVWWLWFLNFDGVLDENPERFHTLEIYWGSLSCYVGVMPQLKRQILSQICMEMENENIHSHIQNVHQNQDKTVQTQDQQVKEDLLLSLPNPFNWCLNVLSTLHSQCKQCKKGP